MTFPEDKESVPLDAMRIRSGKGANCSSIGSVVDTLFAGAAAGTALVAIVLLALRKEAGEASDENRASSKKTEGDQE